MVGERMAAAGNNAEWCDAVCRVHGIPGVTDADAWSVPRRSPPLYPDAVTLRPGVAAEPLVARIDAGAGASVKDSFADLDLTSYGFRVLFGAEWIHRSPAGSRAGPPLSPVTSPERLAAWAAAHGGGSLFRPDLLADPRVTVLARYGEDGEVAGGAVVNRSGRVLGVSNVFARSIDVEQVWRGIVAGHPDLPLVGYESGADLAAAAQVGFRPVGPMRVWLH